MNRTGIPVATLRARPLVPGEWRRYNDVDPNKALESIIVEDESFLVDAESVRSVGQFAGNVLALRHRVAACDSALPSPKVSDVQVLPKPEDEPRCVSGCDIPDDGP